MTSPLASSLDETDRPELPFPPGPVEELLRLVVKAARAHQLYLPNNPIYKGAIDAVRAAFPPLWALTDELPLEITETDIRWFGHPVLEEPGKGSDSLAWLFYKDGIRELRLLKGFEEQELVRLFQIIQRVRKAAPEEDDLLTMFWEADFLFLRYRYVDLAMEPAAPLADGETMPPSDPSQLREAAQAAVEESRVGLVNMADFDSTLYFLDDHEIEYLQSEVRREYEEDLRAKVLVTLLDIFEQQASDDVRVECLEHLDTMLVYLLAAGHFRGVTLLLKEAQSAAQRAAEITAAQRARLAELPGRLSTPEALAQLLQSLDEAVELPATPELVELFEQFRPSALATLLSWLGRTQNVRLRPLLEQAVGRLAGMATAELVRLIEAPEREVALEAMRRAGALKTPAAVSHLSKVLGAADAELRLTAAQALIEIGSPGALQALERAVEDSDREVRIATVRALAARAYRPVLVRIEGVIKGKAIRDADLTEKMAFFEGYGTLCGNGGVAYLDSVLNGKGLLGRREDGELRACAAIALGRIGTANSLAVLQKAAGEKDVVVRNAVNRAMRGASA